MKQTVKYGRIRAMGDPDRDSITHGVYIGMNTTGRDRRTPVDKIKVTRGMFVKRAF